MVVFKKRHPNIEAVVNKWLHEYFHDEQHKLRMATGFEVCGRNIYLYSDKPGILIGYHGDTISKLENMLRSVGIKKRVLVVELGDNSHTHEIRIKRRWI